jgi:hypothetical protein
VVRLLIRISSLLLSTFSRLLTLRLHRSERGEENTERELSCPTPDSDRFKPEHFTNIRVNLSRQATPNFYARLDLIRRRGSSPFRPVKGRRVVPTIGRPFVWRVSGTESQRTTDLLNFTYGDFTVTGSASESTVYPF